MRAKNRGTRFASQRGGHARCNATIQLRERDIKLSPPLGSVRERTHRGAFHEIGVTRNAYLVNPFSEVFYLRFSTLPVIVS
jgi:hypothetical protein